MNRLEFSSRSFDAVVVVNGRLPNADFFQQLADLPLVAADGAANALVGMGIVPEFVVGDLDSVTEETVEATHGISEFVHITEQETTDFEKSLRFAEDQLWKHILVLGMHGGELEHTLNNWSILTRISQRLNITALDEQRYALPITTSFAGTFAPNEMVSIIPQPSTVLTTRGLEWELSNEELAMGLREGARNRALQGDVEIVVHQGAFLLFCDARFPLVPIFRQ